MKKFTKKPTWMNNRLREFLGRKKKLTKEIVHYSKCKIATETQENRLRKKHIKTNNKSFFREWNKKLAREYVGAINGQGIKGIFKEGNPARENLSNFLYFCWQSKKIRNLSRNKYVFLNYISKFTLSWSNWKNRE